MHTNKQIYTHIDNNNIHADFQNALLVKHKIYHNGVLAIAPIDCNTYLYLDKTAY